MSKKKKAPSYRSKFEATVGEFLGDRAEHEPEKISFIQPAKKRFYVPDFKTKGGIYIECKGKWTAEDRFKHVWLREQHPDKRIILLFQNSRVKLNKKSQTTYGDWATKNGMEWLDWKLDGIPENLLDASKKSNRNKRRSSRNHDGTNGKAAPVLSRSRTKRNHETRS